MTEAPLGPAAITRRPPMWVWPSIALGLAYAALARSARLDVQLLERLPEPPPALRRLPNAYSVALVGTAVLLAVIFSLLRVGITDVYTESMVFMALALALGMASPAAGLILVLAYVPLDVVAAAGSYGQLEPLLPALAGRAVSWWLLWLLVVAIPLMARALPGALLASGQPADLRLRRGLAYAVGAAVAGALLLMWTAALPFMIRPTFVWSTLGDPTDAAVQPIQATGWAIVAVGVVLVVAVTAVRQRYGALDEEAAELEDPDQLDDLDAEPLVSDQVEFAGRVVAHVLTVVVLGGLVTGALDVALIFGAALMGQLLATRLARFRPLARLLLAIPWFVRFVGGFALAYVIGLLINNITFEPAFGSEFFPIVLTAAIGLALFQVLLGATDRPEAANYETETSPAMGTGAASLAVALLVSGGALLAAPLPALAGNCSGWGDCPNTMEAVAAAGARAAAVIAFGAAMTAMRLENRNRRRRLRRRLPRRPLGGPGGNLVTRLRDRALLNYGAPTTTSVHKLPDAEPPGSSRHSE